ncbi:hypothetical protein [Acinetobacter sp.]|uniref:hypothetical protein n=1 Tax=Acinetobacter sp. TaxID=472 RepID=UPI00388EEC3D
MNYAEYKNKLTHPSKQDFTVTHFYYQGKNVGTCHTASEIATLRGRYPTAVTEKIVDPHGYQAAAKAYDDESKALREQFIVDLFNEYNVEDNAFTRKLYKIAYEQGHSNGFSDIVAAFSDFYELDKLARETYGN